MRAVGYFREAQNGRSDSIGRQNRRFLDYCEAEGFEVATTFAEEKTGSQGAAFSQLVDYLKKPEKGFMVVVAPSPVSLSEDTVIAAARCLQIERLGANVRFMDSDATANSAAPTQTSSRTRTTRPRRSYAPPCAA